MPGAKVSAAGVAGGVAGYWAYRQSAESAAQANAARKAECQQIMPGYTHAAADGKDMHAYAECVREFWTPRRQAGDGMGIAISILLVGLGWFAGYLFRLARRANET